MIPSLPRALVTAFALGAVGGLRSLLPLALLSIAASRGDFAQNGAASPRYPRSPAVLVGSCLAAAGEVVADKLPVVPARTAPGPLLWRIGVGGLTGYAVVRDAGGPALAGILAGAAGAALGALAGSSARAWAGRASRLPDPLLGAAEDAAALALGSLALRAYTVQS